ncbi:MAG: protein kinase [Planctomycetaceae bacterium]|nr:protein kinase [Planctomycetaceae bacterium]MBT6155532.1 protein kinase [Planctomycetaceae bacterium]MBT6485062.1 protein kinase [Planctomycetaceae bacterium]MBT6493645.1 protein kinase [Planctomycetaceae bacterium]
MKVTLTVDQGPHEGKSYAFEEHDNFIVGRATYAHFRLPKKDQFFSRVHFMVEVNPPYCRLMDMGSRNGTFVNDERVKTIDIHDGDRIKGGKTVIKVSIADRESAERKVTFSKAAGVPAAEAPAAVQNSSNQDSTPIPPAENKDIHARYIGPSDSHSIPTDDVSGETNGADDANEEIGPESARFQTIAVENVQGGITLTEETLAMLPEDFSDRINSRAQPVPGYLIIDELGKGGMGVVYRALCRRDGNIVAIKTIRPTIAVTEGDIDRFLREASILKDLKHPNIVAFHEMGEADGDLFFVMEYVAGIDAARLVADNEGPLGIATAVGIICQLLTALEHAHGQGFVHRDIKPQNMLLGQVEGRGVVKLADFGLARTYQSSRISGLTMMGDVRGTSQYMAPEQITNYRETKPTTDQYAAAATLYFLLTVQYIFDFPNTINGKFQMILQDDPVPIRDRRSEIPDELSAIIHRALLRDPEERFADVTEMRDTLLAFLNSSK